MKSNSFHNSLYAMYACENTLFNTWLCLKLPKNANKLGSVSHFQLQPNATIVGYNSHDISHRNYGVFTLW